MDDADLTEERSAVALDAAINDCRRKALAYLLPDIGQCHNCGTLTAPGRRFCDPECRDDWQMRQRGRA